MGFDGQTAPEALSNTPALTGTDSADQLGVPAGSPATVVRGLNGDDTLRADMGGDTLISDAGNDVLRGR